MKQQAQPTRWYQERELLLLVLLVLGMYFTRLDQPGLRGEETRWGSCARHCLESGDWVVPRQQGLVFPERPPLVNWLIAGCMLLLGDSSLWAIRLPSAAATLGTTVLIYAYSRTFLTRGGALSAAAAFATMGEVLTLGRLGESEAVFTLLVSASLLIWHWGYCAGWPRLVVWCVGFALAALAGLAKGPQGPIYFVAGTSAYLLLIERNWRYLLHPSWLAGLATMCLLIGVWQVPFYLQTDLQKSIFIWKGLAAHRFQATPDFWTHLAGYPLEILVSTLPWSPWLACYLRRDFRRLRHASYLLTVAGIGLAPLWLATYARTRYFMPLYPCLAVLIGAALETTWQKVTVQPPYLRAVFSPRGVLAAAAVMGLVFSGLLVTIQSRSGNDISRAVAELQDQLPADVRLFSFHRTDHRFAWHYRGTIHPVPWPSQPSDVPAEIDYFCFESQFAPLKLPFLWERVAVINCDRRRNCTTGDHVIVGRRIPTIASKLKIGD